MATKQDEFGKWLMEGTKAHRQCETCSRYPEEMHETIKRYMRQKAEGKTLRSNNELHDYLVAKFGYALSVSALSIHMRRCEKELHSQIHKKGTA